LREHLNEVHGESTGFKCKVSLLLFIHKGNCWVNFTK
jgi:hypothetical protein